MATTRHVDRNEPLSKSFSWTRFGSILAVSILLFATKHPSINKNDPWQSRRTTNYGLFAVQERTTRLHVLIAGTTVECPYFSEDNLLFSNSVDVPPVALLCRIVRDQLAHEKNLWYERNDPVHTVHRTMAWTTILLTLVAACFTTRIVAPDTGYSLLDGLTTLWWDAHSQQFPLSTIIYKLLTLNVIVYPALQSMHSIVKLQDPASSWFGCLESLTHNFLLSVLCLGFLSVLVNVFSLYIADGHIGWDCLLIVAMGYQFAFCSFDLSSYSEVQVSSDLLLYTTLIIYCLRKPFSFTLSILLGFFVGFFFGIYQFVGVRYADHNAEYMYRYFGTAGRWLTKFLG